MEGLKKQSDGQATQLWHSSLIVKRVTSKIFLTASGKLYAIEGPMDTDGMRDSTWPDEVIDAFHYGFPHNWLVMLEPYLQIDRKRTPKVVVTKEKLPEERVPNADENPSDFDLKEEMDMLREISRSRSDHFISSQPPLKERDNLSKKNGGVILTKKVPKSMQKLLSSSTSGKRPKKSSFSVARPSPSLEKSLLPASPSVTMSKITTQESESISNSHRSRSGRVVVPPLAYWENQYKKTSREGISSIVNYQITRGPKIP